MKRGSARRVIVSLTGATAAGLLVGVILMARTPDRAPTAGSDVSLDGASSPEPDDEVIEELRERNLTLPVLGLRRKDLRDTFREARGSGRQHEALDIGSSRDTPVVAVEDGTIAKLFLSKPGGITIYQFDPTGTYAYYYAHLSRYAQGLMEQGPVARGQVIGYVGTTGNAPPDAPHLHFAIFKLTAERRWWKGEPIDPYAVFK